MQDERTDTGTSVTPDDDDEERGQGTVRSRASTFASDTELQNRKSSRASSLRQKLGLSSPPPGQVQPARSPHLSHLIGAYDQSDIASSVKDFHEDAKSNPSDGGADLDKIASFKQASWWTQFRILSGRAFKNLYRNPMLMLAHYVVSIVVARTSYASMRLCNATDLYWSAKQSCVASSSQMSRESGNSFSGSCAG